MKLYRYVSPKRVAVEYKIWKMKVGRVASERWCHPQRHTLMMKNVAGLHNRMSAE
jgi:hypothetical protein